MVRLDHMAIPVRDWRVSRDWYRTWFGFALEFESAEAGFAAIRDDNDLTIFLGQATESAAHPRLSFTFQVDDVEAKHRELASAGIDFVHPPMKVFWGYGAELLDPDGYRLRLWDQASMRDKG